MQSKHILIVGKSPAVLESTAALLTERGYKAEVTDNFDNVAGRYDLKRFDLITTGGQVPPDKRAEIRREALKVKSDMLFVQGLAGIAGLIVQQIEGEFAPKHPGSEPTYDVGKRQINISLKQAADVKVTAWWQTTFVPPNPGSDSRVLAEQRMEPGEHSITVPADIPQKASFASVQIDSAVYSFGLSDAEH